MAASEIQIDHIEELLSRAHGTVLELGPGAGDQMFHYKKNQIETLYGAEPNAFLHPRLIEMAEKKLLGKFIPLEAGAQPGSLLPALKKAGLIPGTATSLPEEGVFDSIVAVKSLCSAPQDQLAATVAVVQALLKPGGEFLFFEHVENDTDSMTMSYAWLVDWIWPVFMGGCRLKGKVDKVVIGMGGWDERRITTIGDFKGHEVSSAAFRVEISKVLIQTATGLSIRQGHLPEGLNCRKASDSTAKEGKFSADRQGTVSVTWSDFQAEMHFRSCKLYSPGPLAINTELDEQ